MTAVQPAPKSMPAMKAASAPRRRARTHAPSNGSLRRAGAAFAITSSLFLLAYIGEFAMVYSTNAQRAEIRREVYRERQLNSNLHATVETLEGPARIDWMARRYRMQQRNDADFVALAPLPAAPPDETRKRPVLASFLPRWFGSAQHGDR